MAQSGFVPNVWGEKIVESLSRRSAFDDCQRRRKEVSRRPASDEDMALYQRAVELVAEVMANPFVQWDDMGISAVQPSDRVEYEYLETEDEFLRRRYGDSRTVTFTINEAR